MTNCRTRSHRPLGAIRNGLAATLVLLAVVGGSCGSAEEAASAGTSARSLGGGIARPGLRASLEISR